MVFTKEDKVAMKFLRENKHYGAKHLPLSGLNIGLNKIDETGSIERKKCDCRPRSVRCHDNNIERVEQLAVCARVKAKGGHFEFEHKLSQ